MTTAANRVFFMRIPSSWQMKMALEYTRVARFVKGKSGKNPELPQTLFSAILGPKTGL
jgi:hypothetical protein